MSDEMNDFNGEDSFTEVTEESWFGRIGGAIKGIIVGIVLFIIAFPILWLNEGRAVNTEKKINFAKDNVIAVSADKVNKENEGKLIYIVGQAKTSELLKDDNFNISTNAIKLTRTVSIYQWEEEETTKTVKKMGGGKKTIKTYTYKKDWSDKLIDSNSFKKKTYKNSEGLQIQRSNPVTIPYESKELVAKDVTVGAFKLSNRLINKINNAESLKLTQKPKNFPKKIEIIDGFYFIGKDYAKPAIGDMKIKFNIVKPQEVSIIARQSNNGLSEYQTPYGTYEQLSYGNKPIAAMIASAKAGNSTMTWILRIIGFALMFFGITLIFKPLSVIADVVPFIGDLVGIGTSIIAFLIAAPATLITIGTAWLFYRPLLGAPLIAVAIFLIFTLIKKKKGCQSAS